MPRLARPRYGEKAAVERNRGHVYRLKLPFGSITLGDFELKTPFRLPFFVDVSSPSEHPNREGLMTVQDFFKYAEKKSKQFFTELDRDKDGKITLEDIKHAVRQRKLPQNYAQELFDSARGSKWWKRRLEYVGRKKRCLY